MRNYPCNGAPKATSLLTTTAECSFGPVKQYLAGSIVQIDLIQIRKDKFDQTKGIVFS